MRRVLFWFLGCWFHRACLCSSAEHCPSHSLPPLAAPPACLPPPVAGRWHMVQSHTCSASLLLPFDMHEDESLHPAYVRRRQHG